MAENNAKYWEQEEPLVMSSGNLRIMYYEKAAVLQIGFLVKNEKGEKILGRKMNLKRDKLAETPRLLFFISDVFKKWRKDLDIQENN